MSKPTLLSPAQFAALTAHVEAAVKLAVAEADFHRRESSHEDMGAYYEEVGFREARDAAEKVLVDPDQ